MINADINNFPRKEKLGVHSTGVVYDKNILASTSHRLQKQQFRDFWCFFFFLLVFAFFFFFCASFFPSHFLGHTLDERNSYFHSTNSKSHRSSSEHHPSACNSRPVGTAASCRNCARIVPETKIKKRQELRQRKHTSNTSKKQTKREKTKATKKKSNQKKKKHPKKHPKKSTQKKSKQTSKTSEERT